MLILDFHVFWLQPIIENKNEKKVQQPLPKIVVFFFNYVIVLVRGVTVLLVPHF